MLTDYFGDFYLFLFATTKTAFQRSPGNTDEKLRTCTLFSKFVMMKRTAYYNNLRSGLTLVALALLLNSGTTYAQQKIEREYAIKPAQVPKSALQYVDQIFETRRTKWYAEESQKGRSIEAKVKQDGTIYSIEFDEAGQLQDIETLISFKSLPEALRQAIEKTLEADFSRIKINKVQRQWTGPANTLQLLLAKKEPPEKYITRYELVIRGTKDRSTSDYEVLVDDQGKLIRTSKIISQDNPHLLF